MEIQKLLPTKLVIYFGKDKSKWFRFKAIIKWIWYGVAEL